MAARNVNLVLDQGVDFQATFTIKNTNNAPLNLTGYTGISSIRKHPTSSTAYPLTLTFVDRLNGKIAVSMGYTATENIEGGRYVYDVILISPNSYRTRAVQGNVLVTPGVSQ
jgi:hypothetical protein